MTSHAEALRESAAELSQVAITTDSGGVLERAISNMLEGADALDIVSKGIGEIEADLRAKIVEGKAEQASLEAEAERLAKGLGP